MTEYQSYPGLKTEKSNHSTEVGIEKLKVEGLYVLKSVIDQKKLEYLSGKLDEIWDEQLKSYGEKFLKDIGDFGVTRGLFDYDSIFFDLITEPSILEIIDRILGESAILHLQNGILLFPSIKHNQGAYHRDFAKNFICTKQLSINALIAIDDFTEENGATFFLKGTHLFENMPSPTFIADSEIQITAPAGSIIFFDSLLWHRGGTNLTQLTRRAINQQYTRPFIKQQLDYPSMLPIGFDKESRLAQKMGLWSIPPKGTSGYRVKDSKLRSYRSGQG